MKKSTLLCRIIIAAISIFLTFNAEALQKPRLTVIIVVDQLSQSYIQKIKTYFKHGIRELIDKGVYYPNAYIPHAMPSTGTGHTGLNTGTYAKDHGIIRNSWMNKQGELVKCDDDSVDRAAVFSPTGTYDYGKSPHFIMVDGISDQFMLQSLPEKPHYAYSLSLKSRSAIGSANKLGKAIWFDEKTGFFTSSKAYFDELPAWLKTFNATKGIDQLDHVFWHQAKPPKSKAYQFVDQQGYQLARDNSIRVGESVPIEREAKEPYHFFVKTPQANKLLFDLAQECIKTHINKKNNANLLLWIDLSSLDKIGHTHGPNSKEVLDMIYHLDKQLASFMRFAQRAVGPKDTLFVLTSDHGIAPMPEVINRAGLPAVRIFEKKLRETGNTYLKQKYELENPILRFKTPQFFFDPNKLSLLSKENYREVMEDFKTFLREQPGIKQAWTNEELENQFFEHDAIENYFKQQRYPGRSGSVFILLEPYSQVTKWETGTSHRTPYNHNTHVPLILYQHGSIELKTIGKKVWSLQLANTLADILQIPRPSASTFERLPGLDEELDYLAR